MDMANFIRDTHKMTVPCFSCGSSFADNKELALHIATTKDKKHRNRKSKVWAANFLNRTRALNAKRDLPDRVALTDEQKEAKISTIRPTSGEFKRVQTMCPQCSRFSEEKLEVEYVVDDKVHAWQRGNYFMRLCVNHRSENA